MQAKLSRWGNSLAVRIPTALARSLNLAEDDRLRLEVEDGALIVRPEPALPSRRPTLTELLANMTAENLPDEVEWGPPVGREIW